MGIFGKLMSWGDSPNARALKWAQEKLAKAKQRDDDNAAAAIREAEAEVRDAMSALEQEKKENA